MSPYDSLAGDPLAGLRNLPGVYGCFLVDRSGAVIARELSPLIRPCDLEAAGASLWRIWYCLDASFGNELLLEFAHHRLFARRLRGGSLCALLGRSATLPLLRQACTNEALEDIEHTLAKRTRPL